ncbi:MAG: hypothetical protein CBARDMAM_4066 [uncultured Caballeronia sp.]|nr:MAG: hypothetical protein CBARDMAM_4066 [uncultured Caballeronia sp.]
MLLPLKFATANNALLKGLVAGVPVICSNTHGVREYLPPRGGTTCSIRSRIWH